MNINKIKNDNLCIQCGACEAQCPKKAISFQNFKTQISSECNDCGLCLKICPVNQLTDYNSEPPFEDYVLGNIKKIINVKAKNYEVLHNSSSGAFITATVKYLLDNNVYESAFLVEGYNYDNQLKTKRFIKGDDLTQTAKSRYLPVSHSTAFSYIKNHKQEKIILVCTPCCLAAFNNFIKLNNLDKNNYLLIGLFCDRVLDYDINSYFIQHPVSKGKILDKLYFRTKDSLSSNWPGHLKLCFKDGTQADLDRKCRMEVKDYFTVERCLYCLDKLNKNADISAGDNYINEKRGSDGSNTIILRTANGEEIWQKVENLFEFSYSTKEELSKAQGICLRMKNLEFAKIKGIIKGDCDKQHKKLYKEIFRKKKIAKNKNIYSAIQFDIKFQNFKNDIKKKFFHKS